MQLIVQAAMVFFGTLMAAGLVALGEPPIVTTSGAEQVAPLVQAVERLVGAR